MEKVSFDIVLNLKNNISGALANVRKMFDGVDKSAKSVCSTTARFGSLCSKLKMPDVNALLGVTERLSSSFSELSQGGMSFGQSMADLSSITGIVGDDLEALRENARKVGKDSGLGADTAARAYSILASQIDVATIGMSGLNNLQAKSVTLAQASGMSIDAAATSLAGTINQFGLTANEAERVINVLAAGSKYGAAEVVELSQSFKVVGSAASAMGLTVEQSAGALEVLSKANLKGSEAGTALRNIILKLNTELGVDLSKTSLSSALDALKPKLTDAAYLSKLFGMENIAAAQYLIQNATAVDEMTHKLTGTNVAQEQAAIRTETNAHKLEMMRAKVDDLKISISNTLGGFSAYAAVISENSLLLMSMFVSAREVVGALNKVGVAGKVATIVQLSYNGAVNLGKRALYIYQMQVLAARAAIVSTTGATKLMNIAIAASPYVLAAVAAVALGTAIYKIATRSSEAEKAQKRLGDAMADMNKEVTVERSKLDNLFEPLNRAKEGSEQWNKAKDKIVEQYGEYLAKLGVEIKDVNTARTAYEQLSRAILDTARSRALDSATAKAAETYADKESEALKNIREKLYAGIGSGEGNITAREAGKAWGQIRTAVRSGEDIPEEAQNIIRKLGKSMTNSEGKTFTTNVAGTYITKQISGAKRAREAYEQEIEQAKSLFGQTEKILSSASGTNAAGNGIGGGTGSDPLEKKELTLADIKKKIEELQKAQQTASDQEGRNIQIQINQLETLKKAKEAAMGIGGDPVFTKGSIDSMKSELAKYEKELSAKPVGEASIELQVKIDKLKSQIEGVKIWIEKEAFKNAHGEISVGVVPASDAGRTLGKMAEDFQNEENRKHSKQKPDILTHDYVKKMKLPEFDMPKLEPKKSGFEQWNDAVDKAYQKNQDLVEGMSGIGSVMGSLGQAVGGAAGEWLNWGANVVQAVAAAIPQITTLLGLQSTQVAANTAVAGSGAAASTASIPVVGPILAIAAVASVLAALASLPKFANGGLAYGPTMGLFGEYSGAQNNPEVIAPLNKLRQLIQPSGGMGGIVEFKIDGRMLRGVLNKVDRYNQRTR